MKQLWNTSRFSREGVKSGNNPADRDSVNRSHTAVTRRRGLEEPFLTNQIGDEESSAPACTAGIRSEFLLAVMTFHFADAQVPVETAFRKEGLVVLQFCGAILQSDVEPNRRLKR